MDRGKSFRLSKNKVYSQKQFGSKENKRRGEDYPKRGGRGMEIHCLDLRNVGGGPHEGEMERNGEKEACGRVLKKMISVQVSTSKNSEGSTSSVDL